MKIQDEEPATSLDQDSHLGSLRERVFGSSAWTTAGHAGSMGLRLCSNLLLTRLLFPDAFGLMSMVLVVNTGVSMFSDIGLRGSIIRSDRGEDPAFLNTAWTLQFFQGVWVWLVVCLLAAPMASFYDRAELTTLLPVVGFTSVFNGLHSTAILTLVRRIHAKRRVLLALLRQVAASVVTILCALVWESVWAIAVGMLFGSALSAACSHFLIAGYRNRFQLNREAIGSILRFGRWVFLASVFGFLRVHSDRMILGRIMTGEELGVYSIAFFLCAALPQVIAELAGSVLQPVYRQLLERELGEARRGVLKVRRTILSLALPPMWILAVLGPEIVEALYDPRYEEAGWMLQIMACGAIVRMIEETADRLILSAGDSFRHMLLQLGRSLVLISGMWLGFESAGIPGFLIGSAAAAVVSYALTAVVLRLHGMWLPRLDFGALGLSAFVVGVGLLLRG